MKKAKRALTLAVMASQLAVPAFAADNLNISNPTGWRRQGDGAFMAYLRLPLGGTADARRPRAGFKLVAPRSYGPSEVPLRVNNSTLLDFSVTARSMNSPWTATFNVGGTTAWASNPAALAPEARANLFGGNGWTWAAVGAATVGIGIGIFAVIDQ